MAVNRFSCPGCQTTLKITTPELVGKKIRCPKCATITLVPGAEPPGQPKPEPKLDPAPAAAQTSKTDEDEIAAMLAGSGWEDQPEEPPTKDVVAAPAAAADEAYTAFEEEPAATKRPARMEEEDEDVEPREPAKPPEKKRGGKVLAILVGVIVFGYLGALGAALFGMFDEKPGPEMSKDEAFKVLGDTMRGRKR